MYRYIYVKLVGGDKKFLLCNFTSNLRVEKLDTVIIEKDKCEELVKVYSEIIETEEQRNAECSFIRIATDADKKKYEQNKEEEKKALEICKMKISKHGLPMELILAHYSLDRKKLTFLFTAENRVDFRALVRDLAATFKTRIELWQIGTRDEAKLVGGLGPCGRPLCCSVFLKDFKPVTLDMARKQALNVNPFKISGICGKLMCCLLYELPIYEEMEKGYPKIEEEVEVDGKRGKVFSISPFKGTVLVEFFEVGQREVKIEEIKRINKI